uniref:Putative secreted protein n=1 Tax=Anopheles darlingi TaxID=43151 RepID=A0A2M4DAF8_ANODA
MNRFTSPVPILPVVIRFCFTVFVPIELSFQKRIPMCDLDSLLLIPEVTRYPPFNLFPSVGGGTDGCCKSILLYVVLSVKRKRIVKYLSEYNRNATVVEIE